MTEMLQEMDRLRQEAERLWLQGTKAEQSRPHPHKVRLDKPKTPGGLWRATLWGYWAGVLHQASGSGLDGHQALVEAAVGLEDQWRRSVARKEVPGG